VQVSHPSSPFPLPLFLLFQSFSLSINIFLSRSVLLLDSYLCRCLSLNPSFWPSLIISFSLLIDLFLSPFLLLSPSNSFPFRNLPYFPTFLPLSVSHSFSYSLSFLRHICITFQHFFSLAFSLPTLWLFFHAFCASFQFSPFSFF
jgi:hypothetical protein